MPACCAWFWPGWVKLTVPSQADADVERVLRDSDAGLDQVAVVGDHLPVAIELERAGARVGQLAGRQPDLEEAVALDDEVERVAGADEIALRKITSLATTRAPRPSCSPVGNTVCSPDCVPGAVRVW